MGRKRKYNEEYITTRLYNIWGHMKNRCSCEKNTFYRHYGGRGIKVCEEWFEFLPFYEWAITNGYTDNLTLDRIDVNGNYEPSNCRWVTRKAQSNNRRDNKLVTFNGKTKSIAQWAEMTGIKDTTIRYRIKQGWSVEKTLTTPARSTGR